MTHHILPALLIAASAAAQLTPGSLRLSTQTNTVHADLVCFVLEVKEPNGIWLEDQPAGGAAWIYHMETHWLSRLADQTPAMTSQCWSLPSTLGSNNWAFGYFGQYQQHLAMGDYLLCMADDVNEPGRPPNPVVPVATPTSFSNQWVTVTALGYAVGAGSNPVLDRPPFANSTLQPCDLTGWFPFSVRAKSAPPSLTWLAGAHADTCSGMQGVFGGPPIGFWGACSRWRIDNMGVSMSYLDPVHLRAFRQDLLLATGTTLPPAIAGLALLDLPTPSTQPVLLDLGAILPGLFPNGGFLRHLPAVTQPMTLVNGTNLDVIFTLPPCPGLKGASLHAQAVALDGGGQLNLTDLFALALH